jgi:DNA-binding LytR/AlgR family response regulator
MKIAICDDVSKQLETIKNATIEYVSSQHLFAEIDTFHQGFDFLDAHDKVKYDLVLLDICMPGILGTEVAKEIRLRKDKTEIIFLTTSNEFAIDAFEVNAIHYLLKPFTQVTFDKAMDRAMLHIGHKQISIIYLKCPKGVVHAVDKNSICYIEAAAHRQKVILHDHTTIETVQTLAELYHTLQTLTLGQFITPYKGFIVNQHAISRIESSEIVLKSGKSIPIPRRTFHLVKQTYFDYMFGVMK